MNRYTSWNDNNLLRRVREAEQKDYLEELKELINGEAVAAIQYTMAYNAIRGKNQSYLVSHFTEHAAEEWGHYSALVTALMERDQSTEPSIARTVENAIPATEELTSFDSEYLRDFFKRAEDNAIKAYIAFHDKIETLDKDLADIVLGIIQDEKDHKLDMTRIEPEEEKPMEIAALPEEPVEEPVEAPELGLNEEEPVEPVAEEEAAI